MKNIGSNKRGVLILGIVILVLMALAGWKLVLSPALDAGNAAKAALADTQQKITLADAEIAKQCKTLSDIQTVLVQVRSNQAKFPPTADVSELFNQIRRAANAAGIPTKNISSVQAPAPAVGDIATIAEMPVTISVVAGKNAVTRFLSALESMPRSYLVTNLAVTSGNAPSNVAVTVNGNAYVIQAKSLQDILDQVDKSQVPIKQACHLKELPPLNTTPQDQTGPTDTGAFPSPTPTTAGGGTGTMPTSPTSPTTAPSTQLPIVPVQPSPAGATTQNGKVPVAG